MRYRVAKDYMSRDARYPWTVYMGKVVKPVGHARTWLDGVRGIQLMEGNWRLAKGLM